MKETRSKFGDILAAAKDRHEQQPQASASRVGAGPESTDAGNGSNTVGNTAPRSKAPPEASARPSVPGPVRGLGRPPGKRSDPAFVQVTAYIGRGTHLVVKRALLEDGETQDFSELIEELLEGWLLERGQIRA